ncbi:MAG: TerB family tellurite resistance protein [Pseudomonadota bacterium]|nr:TerB family tellurite resistance protein [Pseudomonadota bacterium]
MNVEDRELLAGVRVLVCVARADGVLLDVERIALEAALTAFHSASPQDIPSLDTLLAEHISLEDELAHLHTPEARQQVHDAAWMVAHADGVASREELALLERILPPGGEMSLVAQVLGETKDTIFLSNIEPIWDPEQREIEVREDVVKYAVLCAGLGALPMPGVTIVTDLVVVGLQVKMVRDIGQYWGHTIDREAARSLLGSAAGSVALRVAVTNLARLVPGWGSVFGGVTSFASTVAIGRMAEAYFSTGGQMSTEEMREVYENKLAEAKQSYAEHADVVNARREANKPAVVALNAELAAGRISAAQYEDQLGALK